MVLGFFEFGFRFGMRGSPDEEEGVELADVVDVEEEEDKEDEPESGATKDGRRTEGSKLSCECWAMNLQNVET